MLAGNYKLGEGVWWGMEAHGGAYSGKVWVCDWRDQDDNDGTISERNQSVEESESERTDSSERRKMPNLGF